MSRDLEVRAALATPRVAPSLRVFRLLRVVGSFVGFVLRAVGAVFGLGGSVAAQELLGVGRRTGFSSLLLSAVLLAPACDKGRHSPRPPEAPAASSHPTVTSVPSVAEREGQTGHIDSDREPPWAEGCMIHRPCAPLPALGRCSPNLAPVDASTIDSAPPGRLGEPLAVRGPLTLLPIWTTEVLCRPQNGVRGCCNSRGAEAMIGAFPHALALSDLGCGGDDSRLCCNVPAFGRTVVAVGKLTRSGVYASQGVSWTLTGATLCEEETSGAARGLSCQASPRR